MSKFKKGVKKIVNTWKPEDELPIRAEVLTTDRLEQHARNIAQTHQITSVFRETVDLLKTAKNNKRSLINIYQALGDEEKNFTILTPSAEWLLDNFHIVEEQFREVKQDLPRKFYKELPVLNSGEYKNFPRIYHLAVEIISHTDNRLEMPVLKAFIDSYQKIKPLTIGELWAFPISLRLALIENLKRFATITLTASEDREKADKFADELVNSSNRDFSVGSFELLSKTFDDGRITEKFSDAFLVRLSTRLRGSGEETLNFALDKLENRLRNEGETTEHLAHREHIRQAAAQVSVANIITSMRLLSTLDWREFFESVSLIDKILKKDPSGDYKLMDFATRNLYRNNLEKIAKRSEAGEIEVANCAVKFSNENKNDSRKSHVGYYLYTENGLIEIENQFDYALKFSEKIKRIIKRHPTFFYLSAISTLTFLFTSTFVIFPELSLEKRILMGLLAIIPESELAITFINKLINEEFKPKPLPKMDFSKSIPPKARTLVVIPTLLTDKKTIENLCGNLEVFHLANRDEQIYFALLGDLPDADSETLPLDINLRKAARDCIDGLNEKHPTTESNARFMFFSRQRVWNEGENKWICRERKRGNLHEFNQLIREKYDTTFDKTENLDYDFLKKIRYIITLDADTQLPRDAARRLIGTIEHPLNRPVINGKTGRVENGYGILQPRIEIGLTNSQSSKFAEIFSACKGFDPYTTAVSDVYQDLFDEGSYVGKGLYDVDAFEAALDKRIPENKLLSHDLFEGLYARVALVTNSILYDDYPSNYETYIKRMHRWTRGDWQIARWILPLVPDADGTIIKNSLPVFARWKILDNLRRSLLAPTIILWLLAAWFFLSNLAVFITLFLLIVLTAPIYLHIAASSVAAIDNQNEVKFSFYLQNLRSDVKTSLTQAFFRLTFLLHEAYMMADAIVRFTYRKFISGKKLLEWVTAAQSDRLNRQRTLLHYYSFMFFSPFASLVIFAGLFYLNAKVLFIAFPFLILWMFAPFVANRLSLPRVKEQGKNVLTADEIMWLKLIARRTWRYFEKFVGESEHWLPPDNFQQDPFPVIAHRTSPTNIGLLLLSTLAARDFGYTGSLETIERIELTCGTLERLQRFQGHFYNWYDTKSLEPLIPQYISTVDSGNLAGHLLAVAEGCREIADAPFLDNKTINGFNDTLDCLKQEIIQIRSKKGNSDWFKKLEFIVTECDKKINDDQLETADEWKKFLEELNRLFKQIEAIINKNIDFIEESISEEMMFWTVSLINLVKNYQRDLQTFYLTDDSPETVDKFKNSGQNFKQRAESIARFCRRLVEEMDFAFLYDTERKVLTIGYRPTESVRDNSFYDLFASEARLASFIAIASGDVEQEHWFRLGRGLVGLNGNRALISWSGTMFEYLMPNLVMRNYENTLLDETYRAVIRRQIQYGKQHNLAWGVSESAYNARDLQLNFQYGPFGVPGLGLKRGLGEDLVVSPYSTALAIQFFPKESMENLFRLAREGMFSHYGFFEAVDYTRSRLPAGQNSARIQSYMSHHQGMILTTIDNFLNEDAMIERFHREPTVESAELLLQERVPQFLKEAEIPRAAKVPAGSRRSQALIAPVPRRFTTADQKPPQVCYLSNGKFTTMLTTAGSGFTKKDGKMITRWREDSTCDNYGSFIYFKDTKSGAIWSSGFQPTARESEDYEVIFSEHKADFRRIDAGILTHTEVIVATEDDAELRRVTLTNELDSTREIEVTSYAEIVLTEQAADEAHPAFSNLFVETAISDTNNTLFAHRRHRSENVEELWAAHTIAIEGKTVGKISFETDRAKFLGRGKTNRNPNVLIADNDLSGTDGATLDPIFSFRVKVEIPANESVTIIFSTISSDSRDQAVTIAEKYQDITTFNREEKLAWTRSQVELRHLGISTDDANLFQNLAGHLTYTNPLLRPTEKVLKLNTGKQKDLWKFGISGDLPIMIVRVSQSKDTPYSVRQVLRSHEYLRLKNFRFDLVILNEQATSYAQTFGEDLQALIRADGLQTQMDTSGGLYLLRADIMSETELILLHTAAKVSYVPERGTLEEQLRRSSKEDQLSPMFIPSKAPQKYEVKKEFLSELNFANEYGGFTKDGKEYLIRLDKEKMTPAPWSNVIANESGFGFLTSETGSGVTWSENSRENRLTVWSNDAVSNEPTECIYLRDEETGSFWTPTALPVREDSPYTIRHGSGYTIFEHTSHGIKQELMVFAPIDEKVKISVLRLTNLTEDKRKLSVTYFNELVLGVNRSQSAPFIQTEIDSVTGAILARNPYNEEFSERIMYAATNAKTRKWTCDRQEFIGRNGNLSRPNAMLRKKLSGTSGAGFDPCAALQTSFETEPGEIKEFIFLLGEDSNLENVRHVVEKFSSIYSVEYEFERLNQFWDGIVNTITVRTPDQSLNQLVNRPLIYQTLACRFWARTSLYQSSGAYGFRDQLQDSMALIYSRPDLTRKQILLAASRQFKEGDVQHWWHEPSGKGTRTKFSDDLLWLVFVVCFYVEITNDTSILTEEISFIDAPLLAEDEMEVYLQTVIKTTETASIYDHCIRAIEKSLQIGVHGLPLIGAGDWNDGMNSIGDEGKGESVWMGWFLAKNLHDFAEICDRQNDLERGGKYRNHAELLRKNIEATAWDGDWYLRAFFDDGTPLGSNNNDECRIDSLSQSWSIISGFGNEKRSHQAMQFVEDHLIDKDQKLALLLSPPFDTGTLEPGYIKSYPPGIRENGGQYTHAAAWVIIAEALLGDGDNASELFSMLNPINRTLSKADLENYKTEPYSIAADVYSHPQHTGRGGWTWYTGAAGWMYQAIIEYILGFKKRGDFLLIEPCIPSDWQEFEITYWYKKTKYHIKVCNPDGVCNGIASVNLDGNFLTENKISLVDDMEEHKIEIILGKSKDTENIRKKSVQREKL